MNRDQSLALLNEYYYSRLQNGNTGDCVGRVQNIAEQILQAMGAANEIERMGLRIKTLECERDAWRESSDAYKADLVASDSTHEPRLAHPVAIEEALDHIDALCDFAYERGFHELGYNPVAVVRVALGQSAQPPPVKQCPWCEMRNGCHTSDCQQRVVEDLRFVVSQLDFAKECTTVGAMRTHIIDVLLTLGRLVPASRPTKRNSPE